MVKEVESTIGKVARPEVEGATLGTRVPEHRTPVDGLYLANMSQIYLEDRGQNYSILMGENVANMVAADLAQADAVVSAQGQLGG